VLILITRLHRLQFHSYPQRLITVIGKSCDTITFQFHVSSLLNHPMSSTVKRLHKCTIPLRDSALTTGEKRAGNVHMW